MNERRGGRPNRAGRGGRGGRAARVDDRARGAEGRRGLPVPPAALDHDAHPLPHESLAPITLAAGVGLLGFGMLTSPIFSLVGVVVIFGALAVWIEEMRHG